MTPKADICIYASTGHVGTQVARYLLSSPQVQQDQLSLLLAGRNVAKVKDLRGELLSRTTGIASGSKSEVTCYEHSVDVTDDHGLRLLAQQARVMINCIDVDCHPRALVGVAQACIAAKTHYVDLAPRYCHLRELFALGHARETTTSTTATTTRPQTILVPSSGMDYCFMDLAVLQAERAFAARPDRVQAVMAVQTGSLGMKWPLRLIRNYLDSNATRTTSTTTSSTLMQPSPTEGRCGGSILSYCKPLSSWSIRLPMGAAAMTLLFEQRHWRKERVDVRLAMSLSAIWWLLYGMVVAVMLLPLFVASKRVRLLRPLVLWMIPKLVPMFTDDYDLCKQSRKDMTIELVVTLSSSHHDSSSKKLFCYHVKGPSPERLNPLCLSLTALELLNINNNNHGGAVVMTPAMAMGDTDLWEKLDAACHFEIHVSDC